jgi:hypothetical protein
MEVRMTEESMALAELVQKVGEGDFLRPIAEAVLQLLMGDDVEGLIGAARHERSAERLNYRNGYRERALDTRLGPVQRRIPKLRQGSYFPPFLESRKMTETGGGDPGSLVRRGLDPALGRPGPGDGARRHLEVAGLEALQGHRRAGHGLPGPAAGR